MVTTIEFKPFLLRSASNYYWASGTQWVTVSSLTPLTSGNHLTPTSITVSGYITNTNYQEYVRYVMHYADGTSYYSESYLASTNSWQTLAADNIPVHAGMRGTVISIDVQVRKTSSASYGAYGRVEVSGFETTP